jgi:response regulator RpfG family c-di-GMP phosphodiesterase
MRVEPDLATVRTMQQEKRDYTDNLVFDAFNAGVNDYLSKTLDLQELSGRVDAAWRIVQLEQTLRASSIELRFAELKDPVKDKLKRFELFDRFGAGAFYPTIGAAVDAYLAEHAVDWRP